MIRRREFITLLGSAATAWPLAAQAQQPAMPVVGFVSGRSPSSDAFLVEGFRRGLRENGFTEGQIVALEFRWADGRLDRHGIRACRVPHRSHRTTAHQGVACNAMLEARRLRKNYGSLLAVNDVSFTIDERVAKFSGTSSVSSIWMPYSPSR